MTPIRPSSLIRKYRLLAVKKAPYRFNTGVRLPSYSMRQGAVLRGVKNKSKLLDGRVPKLGIGRIGGVPGRWA